MADQDKHCRTCRWGARDDLADLVCVNGDSEQCADWVGDDDTCDCWEPMEEIIG